MNKTNHLIRPTVRRLHAYVPGEQPRINGLIKLNTNENPYPPSPSVLAAVKRAVDGQLRLYPNPTSQPLRDRLAKLHRCEPENVIIGNGSDELLAMATRAFVEPSYGGAPVRAKSGKHADGPSALRSRQTVQFFTPSYSLYPVLAAIHGARSNPAPLTAAFGLPAVADLRRGKRWDFQAALSFITTPNAPSGRGYSTAELESLCRAHRGVLILDEAYVDFATENALALALKYPHVLVSRTFSKAYSLCSLRVGYFVGHGELIAALDKIRDSYNVNRLGQVAAMATLDDLAYYRGNFERIIATREHLARALTLLGFRVFPSRTNFVLVRPPVFPAGKWLQELRDRKILVRWFNLSEVRDCLRITIGSEQQMSALLRAAEAILSKSHTDARRA